MKILYFWINLLWLGPWVEQKLLTEQRNRKKIFVAAICSCQLTKSKSKHLVAPTLSHPFTPSAPVEMVRRLLVCKNGGKNPPTSPASKTFNPYLQGWCQKHSILAFCMHTRLALPSCIVKPCCCNSKESGSTSSFLPVVYSKFFFFFSILRLPCPFTMLSQHFWNL